jgi:hypothetical protein
VVSVAKTALTAALVALVVALAMGQPREVPALQTKDLLEATAGVEVVVVEAITDTKVEEEVVPARLALMLSRHRAGMAVTELRHQ